MAREVSLKFFSILCDLCCLLFKTSSLPFGMQRGFAGAHAELPTRRYVPWDVPRRTHRSEVPTIRQWELFFDSARGQTTDDKLLAKQEHDRNRHAAQDR